MKEEAEVVSTVPIVLSSREQLSRRRTKAWAFKHRGKTKSTILLEKSEEALFFFRSKMLSVAWVGARGSTVPPKQLNLSNKLLARGLWNVIAVIERRTKTWPLSIAAR